MESKLKHFQCRIGLKKKTNLAGCGGTTNYTTLQCFISIFNSIKFASRHNEIG